MANVRAVDPTKPRPAAPCHPERRAYAKGLCQTCYAAMNYRKSAELRRANQRDWNARNAEHHRAVTKSWIRRNPERKRDAEIYRVYGIVPGTFDRLNEEQGGLCAICHQPPGRKHRLDMRLHVDHDHATGAVRGLLCGPCNLGLGAIASHLESAIAYLARDPIMVTETSSTPLAHHLSHNRMEVAMSTERTTTTEKPATETTTTTEKPAPTPTPAPAPAPTQKP